MLWRYALACSLVLLAALPALAQSWTLAEDFQGYEYWSHIGSPTGPWYSQGHCGADRDPLNYDNMCLLQWPNGYYRAAFDDPAMQTPQGDSGTVFFRFYLMSGQGHWGLSAKTGNELAGAGSANNWDGWEVKLKIDPTGSIIMPGGTSVGSVSLETWYNVWLAVDNLGDQAAYYIQGGSQFPVQTSLGTYEFIHGRQSQDILSFFMHSAGPDDTGTSALLDDIYVSGGLNTSNPLPEPTAMALLAMAWLGLRRPKR